jgi:hypothetical protein
MDMSRAEVVSGLAAWVFLAGGVLSAEEAPKIEVKADKGQTAEFVVKRSSTRDFGGQARTDESEVEYRIEVAEKKEGGDVVLKVSYGSVKAKAERRDGPWEFDSAKKEGGDEAAAAIREAIAKPITVEVKKGRVTDIVGLAEAPRPGDGEGFRGMRGAAVAGREALRRDLELILAAPVQGEALEKGKVYRAAREERREGAKDAGDGDRRARARFRGFGQPRVAYKFEGDEKVGDVPAAKFSLSTERPESQEGGPRVDSKGEGSAVISLKDGLLLKLELDASTSFEFERDGQTTTSSTRSKTTVTRKAAAKGAERTASRF